MHIYISSSVIFFFDFEDRLASAHSNFPHVLIFGRPSIYYIQIFRDLLSVCDGEFCKYTK